MFLKSLEIRGFKSFADKTELVFKKGITAIVGPNGSGKSNILDAVKWVLGEQSIKNLRGGKMQDVIFSGTEFRKPVGLAQVTLILDNSDGELPIEYSEVTIMRRLFRSGESEYYINNTKCRLKDIQELFMDTGIGKEGYSIIGQGKIEALLSGKPEERRSLLEEAAGIVKFKTRKQEAEKRLENTDQNLQRINDIFSTYEERLEPLKQESEKAKAFLEISKKLKSKEVTLILNNINVSQKRIDFIKKEIEKSQFKLQEIIKEKDTYKQNVENFNKQLEKFELENNEKTKRYYDSKTRKQDIISENNLLNERISNLTNSINKYKENLLQFKEKINSLTQQKLKQQQKLEELLKKQISLEEDISECEKIINERNEAIKKQTDAISEMKSYQVELLSKISQKKNEVAILKNDINNLEGKIQETKVSIEAHSNSIKINISTIQVLKKETEKIDNKIKEYEEKIKNYKKEIISKNKLLHNNESVLKESVSTYNKIEANSNALINLEKQHEGYNRAVKSLMQHIDKDKIPNAKNKTYILGEVLKVDKNFEIAIEIALGGAISNIITDNEIIAKELIKYLKQSNLGRATFLPLNIVKGKSISLSSRVEKIDGYIGVASKLIKYDIKYINAIEYVLGRTLIAKDMDSALNIAKETNYGFKIVTLDGEVINPGGALTGGSLYHKNSNIIGRKREIGELKEKLKIYNKKINELNENINEIKIDIKNMDEAALDLKDEIHYENLEKTKISGRINAIDNETSKLKRDLDTASNELILLKENLKTNLDILNEKEEKIYELDRLQNENSLKIVDVENKLKDQNEEINDKNKSIVSLKVSKAQIDEGIINLEKEVKRLKEEVNNINISSIEKDIDKSSIEISIANNKINENNNEISKIDTALCKFEENFKEIELRRIKLKENIKVNKDNLENIDMLYNKFEKNKNSLEINLARNETEQQGILTKLNDEMELTYAEALELKIENEDINKCKNDIEIYKRDIAKLGVVNLGAIQQYKELMEKYTFMKEQKEDLIQAKEELLNVVKEMTDKMKTVFHENFNKLRENFSETFRELFKGGKADLILESGDELTSNIEINVQPPGKKLQNINLMSGGEKGLSAIALLFAILKMKPTPFCILDEIEAALDDSNVSRYSEFLRKFSSNTQFIIITHRKGSMEVGDVLYGVTMEEKGVSKIVSVDLSKE
ncbi:chromosome segregation protein SMC [Clostridium botulinum]|uniref:Chromosome partition protein Smc n=1 Tax=Clostridium botulinum C/D str. DC5 TaxID=1443128 RepID=A0A0A0IDV4_CLOBO|nr:chromosome segregation protein SMC [Clostridium botulinum]KEI01439.1 chromosome segregation protein SMC [Clostridium botulinum C/D str. BKT75002]KEI07773.1 chromosome segregation protein SMC [Clostridium botulinum C/D str. BKT2873]KGM94167.1 chromosome segregation protein SMC [Clostridium botulinum D str. CCUG 7971]KGM99132.1 chromosome segregation protein SMC [Clostridium botulinum C/D str. DC5]KOC49621.1 chromosome segregation protein SMC [Clostridium botulinum]